TMGNTSLKTGQNGALGQSVPVARVPRRSAIGSLVAGFDPVLVQADMLDGLAVGHEIAVSHVDPTVSGLDDRWIVVLTVDGIGRIAVEVALPFPGDAFVVGKGGDQGIAPSFEIVVNRKPVPVAQPDHLDARAGVG